MRAELKTIRGYDFYAVASVVQKSIRRAEVVYAGYFAIELFESGYSKYLWKRLLTISAEDCYSAITHEVLALYESFKIINEKSDKEKGRIFISKAILLLCEVAKSRDSDHLQCLVYDKKMLIDDSYAKNLLDEITDEERLSLPEYTFDCHTLKGKKMGKTKKDFFKEENKSLFPKQLGLFDDLVNKI